MADKGDILESTRDENLIRAFAKKKFPKYADSMVDAVYSQQKQYEFQLYSAEKAIRVGADHARPTLDVDEKVLIQVGDVRVTNGRGDIPLEGFPVAAPGIGEQVLVFRSDESGIVAVSATVVESNVNFLPANEVVSSYYLIQSDDGSAFEPGISGSIVAAKGTCIQPSPQNAGVGYHILLARPTGYTNLAVVAALQHPIVMAKAPRVYVVDIEEAPEGYEFLSKPKPTEGTDTTSEPPENDDPTTENVVVSKKRDENSNERGKQKTLNK
jgi:hypothetical protein